MNKDVQFFAGMLTAWVLIVGVRWAVRKWRGRREEPAGFNNTTGWYPYPEGSPVYPTFMWRVLGEDGSLWAESSSESECRGLVRPGDVLQRWYETQARGVWRRVDVEDEEAARPGENASDNASTWFGG